MKKIIALLFFIIFVTVSSFSQPPFVNGKTNIKARIYDLKGFRTDKKISRKTDVVVIDKTDQFYKIKFQDSTALILIDDVNIKRASEIQFLKDLTIAKHQQVDMSKPVVKTTEYSKLSESEGFKFEIDHIRYCAGKYRNEIMTGYALALAGNILVASPLVIEFDNKITQTVGIAGIGCGIISAILIIDSNKWMKKIYIGPNGVGLKYNF